MFVTCIRICERRSCEKLFRFFKDNAQECKNVCKHDWLRVEVQFTYKSRLNRLCCLT